MRNIILFSGVLLIGIAFSTTNNGYKNSDINKNYLIHAIAKKYSGYPSALRKVSNGIGMVLMYEESWTTPWEGQFKRPQTLEIIGGMYNMDKHRNWTETEKLANTAYLNSPASGGASSGALSYNWINRGPYNKPGSFRYADLDSTDNTIWAISNGHYGANQFIFKGSLAGDDFKMISGNLPTRFNDMIGFKLGTKKRLLVTTEAGLPYYTDNDGQTWLQPSGLPSTGILSLALNRAGGYKAYATDGQKVYVSNDTGRTYTTLKDFGSQVTESKLYSIRYGKQPGAGNLYLARNGVFYKWNGSDFTQKGTYPQPKANVGNNGWGRFEIQGDTRKLYLHEYNEYFTSTNEGASWTRINPPSYYYGDLASSENMISEQTFAVSPENPDIVLSGYADWLVSKDGGLTTTPHLEGWWYNQQYSGNTPSEWIQTQDDNTRYWPHQDLQGSSFFYDKSGALLSLRYSDGGIFKSYKEWSIPSWTGKDNTVYYNITLLGESSQETYVNAMASGSKSVSDISWGVQDQGDQTSYGLNGTMFKVIQNPGGDGRAKVTGDGLTAFGWSDNAASAPTAMYSGTTFMGTRNMGDNTYNLGTSGIKDIIVDRSNPGKSFWSIGDNGISYHTWNGGSYNNTARNPGGSGAVQALAQSKSTPATIYAVRGNIVYKSTNSGSTWNSGAAWGAPHRTVAALPSTPPTPTRSSWPAPVPMQSVPPIRPTGDLAGPMPRALCPPSTSSKWKRKRQAGSTLHPPNMALMPLTRKL